MKTRKETLKITLFVLYLSLVLILSSLTGQIPQIESM